MLKEGSRKRYSNLPPAKKSTLTTQTTRHPAAGRDLLLLLFVFLFCIPACWLLASRHHHIFQQQRTTHATNQKNVLPGCFFPGCQKKKQQRTHMLSHTWASSVCTVLRSSNNNSSIHANSSMSQQQHTCQRGAFSPSRGSREKCFPFKFQNNESKTH